MPAQQSLVTETWVYMVSKSLNTTNGSIELPVLVDMRLSSRQGWFEAKLPMLAF
jgi:hypothetical protein